MRCRPLALPLALVALLIAAGGAVAQEPAPLPEAAPTAVADPAASPVPAPPLPDPAPDPQPPTPAPPDPPPPAPGPPPPAPAPAAAPPATAPAPAPAATARRPVTGPRERRRPRRARNQEQMDGRVVLFDGRVTVEEVPPARCSSDSCVIADYEIRGLGVRADRDGPALIEVTRARARGSATDRRIDVEVTLRPPGREAQSGSLELDPQDDLLDPATYGGSSLEAAIQEVLQALEPLIGEGGDLEGLVIRFGAGFVQPDGVAAVGVSTRTEGRVVLAPLERGEAPVPRLVGDSPDAGDDPQDETARALVQPVGGVMGDIQEPAAEAGGGGGGVATAVAGFAGSVVGALVTGACQAVGDREDCEAAEEPPPFVLDVLTVVLFVLDDGRGTVQVRCPAGYEGVTGILRLNTEISLGESFRRLADDVQFRCDERVEEVRVRLRPDALRRLEDEDALAARLTAIAVAAGGLRDTDLNVQVAVRLRSRERGSG